MLGPSQHSNKQILKYPSSLPSPQDGTCWGEEEQGTQGTHEISHVMSYHPGFLIHHDQCLLLLRLPVHYVPNFREQKCCPGGDKQACLWPWFTSQHSLVFSDMPSRGRAVGSRLAKGHLQALLWPCYRVCHCPSLCFAVAWSKQASNTHGTPQKQPQPSSVSMVKPPEDSNRLLMAHCSIWVRRSHRRCTTMTPPQELESHCAE